MKEQLKPCPYCGGSGRNPQDNRKLCPVCHGKGQVKSFER